jgi:arylsulfatase A
MLGNRRAFLRAATGAAFTTFAGRAQSAQPPNIVLILCDDLGYGDLNCYGSGISTPCLNQMAADGIRFTHAYSSNPVCSPARAGLLTGRYPTRMGIASVLDPGDANGLPDSETTIAQMLKGVGYATMCVGKWHLGSQPAYLPTNHGFDEWYGIPYSVDQWPRPLMHNLDVIEQPANLTTLTQRYTQWATDFIARAKGGPFFLYMPHSFPHIPLAASPGFVGSSLQGTYGDVVQEIDASVGQVLQSLADNGVDSNTLVIFTSDHGPWYQGSPGRLRGRKGETFEGGVRVPLLARFPGAIPGGLVSQTMVTHLDLLPTIAGLTEAELPANPLDGIDIWPLLGGQQNDIARDVPFLFFNNICLQCARLGRWKLHMTRFNTPAFAPLPPAGLVSLPLPSPELYDVVAEPDESYDRSARNSAVVADILSRIPPLIDTFPPDVAGSWYGTMAEKVNPTPAGCWPQQVG